MKYSAVVMLFLGAVSYSDAKSTDLVQVIEANGMTAVLESASESDSEDDSFLELKGDNGIIDATTAPKGQCTERLWESGDEMVWQMDQFSRKFDIKNY